MAQRGKMISPSPHSLEGESLQWEPRYSGCKTDTLPTAPHDLFPAGGGGDFLFH